MGEMIFRDARKRTTAGSRPHLSRRRSFLCFHLATQTLLSKPYCLPRDDDAAARKISRSDITILDSLDYITDITPQGDTGELCGPVPVSVETRIEGNLELLVKTYAVETVTEIAGTDWSYLGRTDDDRVTLVTCISGKPRSRLVV